MSNILWKPTEENISKTNIEVLRKSINKDYQLNLLSYDDLYNWSIENISDFWEYVWNDTEIKSSKIFTSVISNPDKMPGSEWFNSSRLNFAENLLKNNSDKTAIEFYGENKVSKQISYKELNLLVCKVSYSFRKLGIKSGDRVCAVMPNMPETIILMLASVSIGAIWSSCSPDFGTKGILDRFLQIQPKLLISTNGYYFKGKRIDITEKINKIATSLNTIKNTVIIRYTNTKIDSRYLSWDDLTHNECEIHNFNQLPFNHPLYIMYSSGTTGRPKSIVHSAGGTLIQHLKELKYHVGLTKNDKIFYYTTCGWMMWNWLVSSLAFGSTLILYDGNPFYPSPKHFLKLINDIKVTVFGTSAKYISYLKSMNVKPIEIGSFKHIKSILSTGSPLTEDLFDFVYKSWKNDVQLSSISGGTDIISCFALGNPILPVYRGELQCIGLGMSVNSFDENGVSLIDAKGELVCTKPFPSMPIYFWNDIDDRKYKKTYFNKFKNVWTHGDFILINKHNGVKIFGRSDTTLNPGGVRIGTSEIYQVVELIDYVEDSLVIGQENNGEERIILFIMMKNNSVLNDSNIQEIKDVIKINCSPRHIPELVIQVSDIPYTINGKKVEIAVKNIIHGIQPKNQTALKNPKSLNLFKNLAELKI